MMTLMSHYAMATMMTWMSLGIVLFMRRGFRRHGVGITGYEAGLTAYDGVVRRLIPLTISAWVAFVVAITLLRTPLVNRDPQFVHGILLMGEMLVFHVMWWPIVAPVVNRIGKPWIEGASRPGHASSSAGSAQHPDAGFVRHGIAPIDPEEPRRVASLTPRRASDDLSTVERYAPFVLGAVAIGVTLARSISVAPEVGWSGVSMTLLASGVLVLVGYAFWIRYEVAAPQPLVGDGEVAERYRDAVERNRRFRVRAIFWLETAFAGVLFGAAYLALEAAVGTIDERMLGLVGGIAGSLVGLGGGIFGILAGSRAQELRSLRTRLAESAAVE